MITILSFSWALISTFLIPIFSKRVKIVLTTYGYGLANGYSLQVCSFIMAQFRHETANFESELFKGANNVSGMKVPKTRPTYGMVGTFKVGTQTYAKYSGVCASVIDYFYRQREFDMPKDFSGAGTVALQAFVAWNMGTGYFTDNMLNYMAGCERWMAGSLATAIGAKSGGNYTFWDHFIFWSWIVSFLGFLISLYFMIRWIRKRR